MIHAGVVTDHMKVVISQGQIGAKWGNIWEKSGRIGKSELSHVSIDTTSASDMICKRE